MRRTVPALGFMGAAALCGYLFLAGFEYPGVTTWKVVTGALAVLFLGLGALTAAKGRRG